MSDTPETDAVIEKIKGMGLEDQKLQLIAHGLTLERQRESLSRQLKTAQQTIRDYQDQWIEENV